MGRVRSVVLRHSKMAGSCGFDPPMGGGRWWVLPRIAIQTRNKHAVLADGSRAHGSTIYLFIYSK